MSKPYLITYDIAGPRRLARLHRKLKRFATPIQYSVFHGQLTDKSLQDVVRLIHDIINPKMDDVRIYPLPKNGWARSFGKSVLPTGIYFTSLPLSYLPERDLGDDPFEQDRVDEDDVQQNMPSFRFSHNAFASTITRSQSQKAKEIQSLIQTGQKAGFLLIP